MTRQMIRAEATAKANRSGLWQGPELWPCGAGSAVLRGQPRLPRPQINTFGSRGEPVPCRAPVCLPRSLVAFHNNSPSARGLRGQPHLPGPRAARPARPGPAGRLSPGLGLAAAQGRAGKAPGCVPVWAGTGAACTGARAEASTGHIPGTGLRKSSGPRRVEFGPGTAGAGFMRVMLNSGRGEPPQLRQDRPGVERAPKGGAGNGAPAARRRQLCSFKMAEKGVPGHPLPGSSSGEPRAPVGYGNNGAPRARPVSPLPGPFGAAGAK